MIVFIDYSVIVAKIPNRIFEIFSFKRVMSSLIQGKEKLSQKMEDLTVCPSTQPARIVAANCYRVLQVVFRRESTPGCHAG